MVMNNQSPNQKNTNSLKSSLLNFPTLILSIPICKNKNKNPIIIKTRHKKNLTFPHNHKLSHQKNVNYKRINFPLSIFTPQEKKQTNKTSLKPPKIKINPKL